MREHLATLDHKYGDFAAHDGLWSMCEKTKDDVVARMALVPRTLEARGLDATPLIQAKLRRVNTPVRVPDLAFFASWLATSDTRAAERVAQIAVETAARRLPPSGRTRA